MSNPSSYVSVNGVNIPLSGTTGANVSSGGSIVVQLVNPAGVQSWNISCYGVDEFTSQTAVNPNPVEEKAFQSSSVNDDYEDEEEFEDEE